MTSRFQQKLDTDPELKARCDALVEKLRAAAQPHIESLRESERITSKDLMITINARAEDMDR